MKGLCKNTIPVGLYPDKIEIFRTDIYLRVYQYIPYTFEHIPYKNDLRRTTSKDYFSEYYQKIRGCKRGKVVLRNTCAYQISDRDHHVPQGSGKTDPIDIGDVGWDTNTLSRKRDPEGSEKTRVRNSIIEGSQKRFSH